MSSLWTLDAMREAMHAEGAGALPTDLSGISIDSRTLVKGDAFFAIKGESRDGHAFVEAALKAGAGAAVVGPDQRDRFGRFYALACAVPTRQNARPWHGLISTTLAPPNCCLH